MFQCDYSIEYHDRDIDNYDRYRITESGILHGDTLEELRDKMAQMEIEHYTPEEKRDSYHGYDSVYFGNIVEIARYIDADDNFYKESTVWKQFEEQLKVKAEAEAKAQEMAKVKAEETKKSRERAEFLRLQKIYGEQ